MLLEELYDGSKHQAIVCQIENTEHDGVPTTVFRLQKAKDKGTLKHVVAVASLQATESIATAHERDLVEWREMVAEGRLQQQVAIDPSDAIGDLPDVPVVKPATMVVESKGQLSTSSKSIGSSNGYKRASQTTTKVTTAASFFGSKSKTATAATKTTTITTVAPTDVKTPQPTKAKENKARTNQVAPVPRLSSKAKVGTADDFVGDEEDSDDDDQERVRQEQQAARRKAVQEANLEDQDLETEPKEEFKVVGAMDSFATATPKPPSKPSTSTRQRKRRKKLVEETVMVNGYLRTETKAIWEDVPTDEEEDQKPQQQRPQHAQHLSKKTTSGQSTAKAQQGMKQKSLMGFFSKK